MNRNEGVIVDFGFPSDFTCFRFQEGGFGRGGSHILWKYKDYFQGLKALKYHSPLLDNYLGNEGYGKPKCYILLQTKKGQDFQFFRASRGLIGASNLLKRAKSYQILGFSDDELDIFRREDEIIKNGMANGEDILSKLDSDWHIRLKAEFIQRIYLNSQR